MDNRKKLSLINDDKKYIWHPFTQMADWTKNSPTTPLIIDSGRGAYLYDIDGKKYIDGVSSLWVNLHGHRHKEINKAIKSQLDKISHSTFLGLTHEPAINLAKELVSITPKNLTKVFYSDNGSTAVEIALKMAYQYWQQTEKNSKKINFVSLQNAYHGDTVGSVSVGGISEFHHKFRTLLFKTYFAQSPYCYECPYKKRGEQSSSLSFPPMYRGESSFFHHCKNMGCYGQCLGEFKKILEQKHSTIAAAVIEPMIQAAAGMLIMPPGYMKEFERTCRKYNILLICDEVATGFGRTGKMFAIEHENIQPDFLCLAKGITGGYLPLAATITSDKIYKAFLGKHEELKTFFHGHTYTANPLGCAAALANIEIFKKEQIIRKIQNKISHLEFELSKLKDLDYVGEIRQLGFMVGIELVKNNKTKEQFPLKDKIGIKVSAGTRHYGVILRPLGNVIIILPPLNISNIEISRMIHALKTVIKTVCSQYHLKTDRKIM